MEEHLVLASVAQTDALLTGDQMFTGLICTKSGNILSWRLIRGQATGRLG